MKLRIALCLLASMVIHTSDIFLDIQYRDHKSISRWFATRPDFNIVNKHGQTLLVKAVQSGNKSLVRRFLQKHIDVNLVDDFGKTALDYAVEYGHKKIVLELVKCKAMVTSQENMVTVKQIIKNKYRALRAISAIFQAISLCCLGVLYMIPIGISGFAPFQAVSSLAIFLPSAVVSVPARIRAISWKDRMSWYNPSLITTNNAIIR